MPDLKKLSTDEIISKISLEIDKRKKLNIESKKILDGVSEPDSTSPHVEKINLHIPQEPVFTEKSTYSINDFTKLYNHEFLTWSYRILLGREPDSLGLNSRLLELNSGKKTKAAILTGIRYSKEGRRLKVKVQGLQLQLLKELIGKVPVLSYLVHSLNVIARLPKLIERINQLENHILGLTEINNKNATLLQGAMDSLFVQTANIEKTTLKADRAELDAKVDRIEFSEKAYQIETEFGVCRAELEYKADKAELEAKADRTELEVKADKAELEAKADRTELEVKADKAELEVKADRFELESKVSEREFEILMQSVSYAKEYLKLSQERISELAVAVQSRLPSELTFTDFNVALNKNNHELDEFYVAFENRFRGKEEDIKDRVRIYLPFVKKVVSDVGNYPVLDVGCGRGEWLSLLHENSIDAKGVDLNQAMVAMCRAKNLDAELKDVIEYLKDQKDQTLSVITGFHIIEHLPFSLLIKLYDEAIRVLVPGGMIIFETPNPENLIVGGNLFYTDPTHINPIPPETTKFIVEQRGFVRTEVLRLHKYSDYFNVSTDINLLEQNMCNEMDYGVLGYKP